jgi:hypothetical protein
MNVGPDGFEAAQQIGVVAERQLRMEPVDDMDFGERFVHALPKLGKDLLERHRMRAGIVRTQARKRAEEARGLADVRGLEPQVVIEIRPTAMPPFAFAIRHPPDGQKVGRLKESQTVVQRQALAAFDLVGDVEEVGGRKTGTHVVLRSSFLVLSSSRPRPVHAACACAGHRALP